VRRTFYLLWTLNFVLCTSAWAQSDLVGRTVVSVRVEQEGRVISDRLILDLIETKVGMPLSMTDVRESLDHLFGLGRFDDVVPSAVASGSGVEVTFVLVPSHPVEEVVFRGALGISEGDLRRAMTQRFGALPPPARLDEVVATLRGLYRDRGYLKAAVTYSVDVAHDPDRSTVVFTLNAGPRAPVGHIRVEGVDAAEQPALLARLGMEKGGPYDSGALRRELDDYERELRRRGYYEARADVSQEFTPAGEASLTVVVDRGPHVVIAYAGDRLPPQVAHELVPVQQEASVDEDLLENSALAIEDYLKRLGYRDASAMHARQQQGNEMVITFTIARGPRYVLEAFTPSGNQAVTTAELRGMLPLKPGEPFVQATLDAAVGRMRALYQARGFVRAKLDAVVSILPKAAGAVTEGERVQIGMTVVEGPRTLVGAVSIDGNKALTADDVRALMTTGPGQPYSDIQLASDQDRIKAEYLNRGYASVVVDPRATFAEGNTRADVRVAISEGPQVMVDHIIILGNERTNVATIQRALRLRTGEPLGYAARIESQQRLAELGLFRRVQITERAHGSEPRADVIVRVEEAPPTSVAYGGGVETWLQLRSNDQGQATERLEFAPRGSFEIGRRNLWGKNRSIELFTRFGLRARSVAEDESRYEYRVVGSYREPRVFDTPADVVFNAVLQQSARSSFSFKTRGANAQAGMRLSPVYSVTGSYSFRHTRLFAVQFDPDDPDAPIIDRLFPQVRLSTFGATGLRDTRNDVLDAERGSFVSVENDIAAKFYGSEVGFAKTYLQAFNYHRLPGKRRVVLALAGRLGLAHGFVDDAEDQIPASERFFAGGDTTVRGFSLDRLGDENTITSTGFPTGGNGLVVLNAELRVAAFSNFTGAVFLDAGNVFLRASDLDVTNLRPAAGVGVRYKSPVGPIRVDWGFNLDRRALVPGRLERGNVLHISLGQPF
jgi:outer membrane protein insertion porin family